MDQTAQSQRELNKKILDRIASDPTFREELLDDPRGAMERAGFRWEGGSDDEVSGYALFDTTVISTGLSCPGKGGGGGGVGSTAITCGGGGKGGGGGVGSTAITCGEVGGTATGKGGGTSTTPPGATGPAIT